MAKLPVIVFLQIFQDGGLYPSLTASAVISSSCDYRDSLATLPGRSALRICEDVCVTITIKLN